MYKCSSGSNINNVSKQLMKWSNNVRKKYEKIIIMAINKIDMKKAI